MRGVFSRACVEAITEGARDCDICGMRFSPTPHAHLPGNMFLARCGYISRLLPPEGFRRKMDALYRSLNRKNWSPREVAAAIADEVGRNH